jgi:hypothetical protein
MTSYRVTEPFEGLQDKANKGDILRTGLMYGVPTLMKGNSIICPVDSLKVLEKCVEMKEED